MLEIPVSIGELFDKITILEIKQKNFKSEDKRTNVSKELNLLKVKAKDIEIENISRKIDELRSINETLWNSEILIRKLSSNDPEYIVTSVHIRNMNDKRADVKRQINLITGSSIVEEKEHL